MADGYTQASIEKTAALGILCTRMGSKTVFVKKKIVTFIKSFFHPKLPIDFSDVRYFICENFNISKRTFRLDNVHFQ